ncbi:MAG TPA: MaoC/PaaZ C-terminal domain-containing protein [Burkholderiaceae bacterium]|nr:MaoC/PaaZ C-terminal domain-containing protein [Burkholderiaceae bacterium]
MKQEQKSLTPGSTHRSSHGPVTTTQLVKYAGASGDFSRLHFDYPFVREAGLEGVLVHGMLTMAFTASCLAEHVGEEGTVTELSGRFLAPVYAGQTVDTVSTVIECEGELTRFELTAQVGDKVVMRGQASALRDPGSLANPVGERP